MLHTDNASAPGVHCMYRQHAEGQALSCQARTVRGHVKGGCSDAAKRHVAALARRMPPVSKNTLSPASNYCCLPAKE